MSVSEEKSTKSPQTCRGNLGAKFGAKIGMKLSTSGAFRFCNFSDLTSDSQVSILGSLADITHQHLIRFSMSKTKNNIITYIETFIARTACKSRQMRKTCAEALSGPLSHLSPKLCESCARTTFAQFLRKKWGSRTIFAHFF